MSETKQQGFSKSLRALADWYDQHPQAPVPDEGLKLSILFKPDELSMIPADETKESIFEGNGMGLYRRYLNRDEFAVEFYTGLDAVAEKRVTQKIADVVEWIIKQPVADVPGPVATSEGQIEG